MPDHNNVDGLDGRSLDTGDASDDTTGAWRRLLVSTARILLPLAKAYCRPDEPVNTGDPDRLSDSEARALKVAASKLVTEAGKLLLANYPVTPQAAALNGRATIDGATTGVGQFPEPSLAYVVAAVRAWRAHKDAQQQKRLQRLTAAQSATFTAATGQFAARPIAANELRLLAMNSATYPQQVHHTCATQPRAAAARASSYRASSDSVASRAPTSQAYGQRCGCSGSGQNPAATPILTTTTTTAQPLDAFRAIDEDRGLLSMSPETKARLRECLASVTCELMLCLGDDVCVDGKVDFDRLADNERLADCLSRALCTVIQCIPAAICPPSAPALEPTCAPSQRPRLPCNFAVEETY